MDRIYDNYIDSRHRGNRSVASRVAYIEEKSAIDNYAEILHKRDEEMIIKANNEQAVKQVAEEILNTLKFNIQWFLWNPATENREDSSCYQS